MKRAILGLTLLALASCVEPVGPERSRVSALIDGDLFVATSLSWKRSEGDVSILAHDVWPWGSDPDEPFHVIGFEFPDQGTGTVAAYQAEVAIGLDGFLANEDAGSTSISVFVSTDKRIAGTFSFTLIGDGDTVRITNGRFDIHLDTRRHAF